MKKIILLGLFLILLTGCSDLNPQDATDMTSVAELNSLMNDAVDDILMIDAAIVYYCGQTACDEGKALTFTDLRIYMEYNSEDESSGFRKSMYEIEDDITIIGKWYSDFNDVYLEGTGPGTYEYSGEVDRNNFSRDDLTEDTD